MNFETNDQAALAFIAAKAPADTSALAGMSKTEKIQYWVSTPRYHTTQLESWVSYPTEGTWAGKALLVLPGQDIQGVDPGYARVTLNHFKIDDQGRPTLKVCLSYISVAGECKLLCPANGEARGNTVWVNIDSNPLLLEELLDSACFDASIKDVVSSWVNTYMGESKGLPLILESFQAILKPNIVGFKKLAGRKVGAAKPGEDSGLGFDLVGFQGAKLLSRTSGLMNSPKTTKVYSATMAQIINKNVAPTIATDDDLI